MRRVALLGAGVLAGCDRLPSVLVPQTPEARAIADLFWTFTGVASVVWLAVAVVLARALLRRRRAGL